MTIENVLQHDAKFRYQLLSRLCQDCEYCLSGMGNTGRLWGGNPEDHIAYMRALYKSFPKGEKPVWCTKKQIEEYAKAFGVG